MSKVKIYSTTTCPYCKLAKEYFKEKGVEYEDVLLDQQPEKVQASIDTCGSMGVPCIHITKDDGSEAKILGFDKIAINQALGL